MKKIFLSLLLSALLLVSFNLVNATMVTAVHSDFKKQDSSFENLKEYNVLLIGNEKGVSTYSGVKNKLRLNFTVLDNEVNKIIFLFDFDTGEAERAANIMETITVAANLMPNKVESLTEAQDKLVKKLSAMKTERDKDVFMLGKLRFECAMNNGVVNIRVTQ